jgi:hypothetical protein
LAEVLTTILNFKEMAYQTGILNYKGSFKSIRNYKTRKDSRILAGEKGGANRDLIMNNPTFARTRENMTEFKGCGVAVKAIRLGLDHLIPVYTDTRFTGRLVSIVKKINVMDPIGVHGKRAILFSNGRTLLKTLTLHEKRKIDHQLRRFITINHPRSRAEATIRVNGLNPNPTLVPANAQYYRVVNHLSIISDYAYSANSNEYEALSPLTGTSVFAYSDFTPVNTPLTVSLKAAFPEGTELTEADTVLQCVGIVYYIRSGADDYFAYTSGSMLVYDVF